MSETAERFELPIAIKAEDIDVLGHVNNVVYLRWVQDAAVAHWDRLATPEMKAEALWVAVRHEIDYKRPAMPGDAIVAVTWVGPAGRRLFERNTEILRATDRKLLARARTLWCPVDPQTLRAIDLGPATRERFSSPGGEPEPEVR